MRTLCWVLLALAPLGTGCIKRIHTEVLYSPTHDKDIQPIWDANCVKCHGGKDPEMGLDLGKGYAAIYEVQAKGATLNYIQPGSPELSYIYLKITDGHDGAGGEGGSMPPFGTLYDTDLQTIENWITFNAPQ